jgi:hypothetical protein
MQNRFGVPMREDRIVRSRSGSCLEDGSSGKSTRRRIRRGYSEIGRPAVLFSRNGRNDCSVRIGVIFNIVKAHAGAGCTRVAEK